MQRWLITIANIARLRAGPQDLPTGIASALLGLACFAVVVVLSGAIQGEPTDTLDLAVSFGVPLLSILILLQWRGYPARFPQTVAALFGSGALISLVNLPLWLVPGTAAPAPIVLVAVIGLCWSLTVDGHIWRNALEVPLPLGMVTAVLILIVQASVFQFLSGGNQ